MLIHPVVLCGGAGTRLWPASRPSSPKQFVRLVGEDSTFVSTIRRFQDAGGFQGPLFAEPVIVTGRAHAEAVRQQLGLAGAPATILVEPTAQDTAPAIAAAALWVAQHNPHAVLLVVAADHHIPDAAAFREAVRSAFPAASSGAIITFGVRPTSPSTAYGYIRPGDGVAGGVVKHAEAFVEKPDSKTAARYVADGYLWNSGNFMFDATVMLNELDQFAPQVLEPVRASIAGAERRVDGADLGSDFTSARKISIDYAVMERTARAAVLPLDFEWSDLGAWDAVMQANPPDQANNVLAGQTIVLEGHGCLIRSGTSQIVAAVGISDIAIVSEPDAILVCRLDQAQRVKEVAAQASAIRAADGRNFDLPELVRQFDRWVRTSALPLWWALGADHQGGGFHEQLASDGAPVSVPRRLRVQARQVYSYATAAQMGWLGPAGSATQHGLDYMLGRYRRSDGLYRTLVTPEGQPLEDTAMVYDQAFVLLALASAYVSLGLPDELKREAYHLLAALTAARAWRTGGFVEFSPDQVFLSNPHMHMLEAALAWAEADDDERWKGLADAIAELALAKFIGDSRILRENFNADWLPASGQQGRLVEPGHQFEWAWLLNRWAQTSSSADAGLAAASLLTAGRAGIDPDRGVVISSLFDDLTPNQRDARLWPQTEWLKAEIQLGPPSQMARALLGIQKFLQTPVQGLWRDRMTADGYIAKEPAPASSLYHLVCSWEVLTRRSSNSFDSTGRRANPHSLRPANQK